LTKSRWLPTSPHIMQPRKVMEITASDWPPRRGDPLAITYVDPLTITQPDRYSFQESGQIPERNYNQGVFQVIASREPRPITGRTRQAKSRGCLEHVRPCAVIEDLEEVNLEEGLESLTQLRGIFLESP
jgi:hypothetical protein